MEEPPPAYDEYEQLARIEFVVVMNSRAWNFHDVLFIVRVPTIEQHVVGLIVNGVLRLLAEDFHECSCPRCLALRSGRTGSPSEVPSLPHQWSSPAHEAAYASAWPTLPDTQR